MHCLQTIFYFAESLNYEPSGKGAFEMHHSFPNCCTQICVHCISSKATAVSPETVPVFADDRKSTVPFYPLPFSDFYRQGPRGICAYPKLPQDKRIGHQVLCIGHQVLCIGHQVLCIG